MKLAITTLAFSIAAISFSATAFAQTRTVFTEDSRHWVIDVNPETHEGINFYEFYDNEINPSGAAFATLRSGAWYMNGNYLYTNHVLTIHLDRDSPYSFDASSWHASGIGIFDFEQSYIKGGGGTVAGVLAGASPFLISTDVSRNRLTIEWGVDGHFSSRPTDFYRAYGGVLVYNLPIPEPETWAMLLAGLGVVGAITRRQRAKAPA